MTALELAFAQIRRPTRHAFDTPIGRSIERHFIECPHPDPTIEPAGGPGYDLLICTMRCGWFYWRPR